ARASALELLTDVLGPSSLPSLERALSDADGLVRMAGVDALGVLPPAERVRLGASLLSDPLRVVRLETASALAGDADRLAPERRKSLDAGLARDRSAPATKRHRP